MGSIAFLRQLFASPTCFDHKSFVILLFDLKIQRGRYNFSPNNCNRAGFFVAFCWILVAVKYLSALLT